jgi:integrase
MAGVPSPTDNPVVEAVRSASQRILGTATVNRKEPISSDLIHKIVSHANLDNPVDLRNVTMYVLCFTGFFRFDDISRVRRSDISFNEGFMVIQVHKSKNDQLRRGNEVVISELSSPACPVNLLRRYLDKFQIPPIRETSFSSPFPRGRVFAS